MLINKENITQFIPQRSPFIMVDELETADEKGFLSHFTIDNENIFLENDILSESAMVENVAQTCAAGFGYLNSLEDESEPKIGFIGAVTRLIVDKHPQKGAKLRTEVEIVTTFGTIHLIKGVVYENDVQLIECQMKIVLS